VQRKHVESCRHERAQLIGTSTRGGLILKIVPAEAPRHAPDVAVDRQHRPREAKRHDAARHLESHAGKAEQKRLALVIGPGAERLKADCAEAFPYGRQGRVQVFSPGAVEAGGAEGAIEFFLSGLGHFVPIRENLAQGGIGRLTVFHCRPRAQKKPHELIDDGPRALVRPGPVASHKNFGDLGDRWGGA